MNGDDIDLGPLPVDTNEGFDEFLKEATLMLNELWTQRKGGEMKEHELHALNDLLTQFFSDKLETR